MKRKAYYGLLCAIAAASIVFSILHTSLTGIFTSVISFPFEQIGTGLRLLSLSGGIGNAIAIIIYIVISLLPTAALLCIKRKRNLSKEDVLLVLLSASLFTVLYIMINPGYISTITGGAAGQTIGKAILGTVVYSVICGYIVLRILRQFSDGGTDKLLRYMTLMLGIMNILFVYMIFGAYFSGMLASIKNLRESNSGNESGLGPTCIFMVLHTLVSALPYALNILIVFAAQSLLDSMRLDRYSEEIVYATERLTRLCTMALAITVLSNIGFNVAQLLFVSSLRVINSSLQIPLFSMAFVLAALLLTRFVAENKKLKDDNDMFI